MMMKDHEKDPDTTQDDERAEEDCQLDLETTDVIPAKNDSVSGGSKIQRWLKNLKSHGTTILLAGVVVLFLAIFLPLWLSKSDEADETAFNIVNRYGINQTSPDYDLKIVLEASTSNFLESCKGGVIVGVTRNGSRVFHWQGFMEYGTNMRVTDKTLYEIGSISKTFTGLLFAQQVIDGLVKVNDTINAYLPDYIPMIQSDDGVPLTLRHLVSHTLVFHGRRRLFNVDLTVATLKRTILMQNIANKICWMNLKK